MIGAEEEYQDEENYYLRVKGKVSSTGLRSQGNTISTLRSHGKVSSLRSQVERVSSSRSTLGHENEG